MRRNSIPIQTLLLRAFLPAVAVVAIGLGLLSYNRLYATILDSFDRKLAAISALTGAMIDGRDHDRLIAVARTQPESDAAERSPEYLRAVEPMRRIRDHLDITYLYTQILGGRKDIRYVLDATEGADHSLIGSEDELPPETLAGIRQVEARGGVHLSPIEFQEQWGLLKTAAAPVRDADGRIVATAGADVNVSLIRTATQNALFTSVVIGMASLLACTLVILMIVRRIARPLDRLRQEALRIAAGDHRPIADFAAPRDIAGLRHALARSSSEMTARLAARRDAASAAASEAGLAALDADLARIAASSPGLDFAGPAGNDAAALLRRAAAARLARRIAADSALVEAIDAEGPLMILAEGETAVVTLTDGRKLVIGTSA
jgi:hypothetical protein